MPESMRSIQSKHLIAFAVLIVLLALLLVSRLVSQNGIITGRAFSPIAAPFSFPWSSFGLIWFPIAVLAGMAVIFLHLWGDIGKRDLSDSAE